MGSHQMLPSHALRLLDIRVSGRLGGLKNNSQSQRRSMGRVANVLDLMKLPSIFIEVSLQFDGNTIKYHRCGAIMILPDWHL
jgi:hypothetical protein